MGSPETEITIQEAARRFEYLTATSGGVIQWIEICTRDGVWRPKFSSGMELIAYKLHPIPTEESDGALCEN
jgi:hypothetical protein